MGTPEREKRASLFFSLRGSHCFKRSCNTKHETSARSECFVELNPRPKFFPLYSLSALSEPCFFSVILLEIPPGEARGSKQGFEASGAFYWPRKTSSLVCLPIRKRHDDFKRFSVASACPAIARRRRLRLTPGDVSLLTFQHLLPLKNRWEKPHEDMASMT
jgi:hypothetical protein